MGEEDGVEVQIQEFAGGFSEFGGAGAILVGEEFELVEMDHRISEHEVPAIAPGGFARCGTGEIDQGKSGQGIAILQPGIGFDLSTGGCRSVDGSLQCLLQGEAIPLVVSTGERNGMHPRHAQNLSPCVFRQRQGIENHPARIRQDRRAATLAANDRIEAMPDGKVPADPIHLGNRLHTSKNNRSLPRNPAL